MSDGRACPVCNARCVGFARATVLGRHEAEYARCTACGSVHVVEPHWLDEAYADAIARTDVGLAGRCVWASEVTALVLRLLDPSAGRLLDYGGGTGLFVRLMRDAGWPFRWFDPYAHNDFAPGHEASLDDGPFDLVTAFEVLEHLSDPRPVLASISAATRSLLCTTEVLPEPAPRPSEWWYYSLGTGQHVLFCSRRGLDALAVDHGWRVTSGAALHLFTRPGERRLPAPVLRVVGSRRVARHAAAWAARPSLLDEDYRALAGRSPHR